MDYQPSVGRLSAEYEQTFSTLTTNILVDYNTITQSLLLLLLLETQWTLACSFTNHTITKCSHKWFTKPWHFWWWLWIAATTRQVGPPSLDKLRAILQTMDFLYAILAKTKSERMIIILYNILFIGFSFQMIMKIFKLFKVSLIAELWGWFIAPNLWSSKPN